MWAVVVNLRGFVTAEDLPLLLLLSAFSTLTPELIAPDAA
jgi:hypothetical protein